MKKIEFKEIKTLSEDAYDFIMTHDLSTLENKKYILSNGVYINVESYFTQEKRERKFEAHKKYIDIQIVIQGEEYISVLPIKELKIFKEYDELNDIAFFDACKDGYDYLMRPKEALVLYPSDGHMLRQLLRKLL